MTPIPSPHVIGVRAWSGGEEEDAHGVPSSTHALPVPVNVHAVGPRVQAEPGDPRRWVVVEGLTIYAGPGVTVGEHDLVLWPCRVDHDGNLVTSEAVEWEVVGPVADWTHGPWDNPAAGVTFDVQQVRG